MHCIPSAILAQARTVVAQALRSSSKMQAATQQLESEAAAAKAAHEADVAAWAARMRVLGTRMAAQQEAMAASVVLELRRVEEEHDEHATVLMNRLDELEIARAREKGWSQEEVQKLSMKLATIRQEAEERGASAGATQQALNQEAARMRTKVATLEGDLVDERNKRAEERETHMHMIAELQQTNSGLRSELGRTSVELEQVAHRMHMPMPMHPLATCASTSVCVPSSLQPVRGERRHVPS